MGLTCNHKAITTIKGENMEYRTELNSIDDFEAWAGGKVTLETVRERGGIDQLTELCEEVFLESTPTETQINDWLWFDRVYIFQELGYYDLIEE